MFLQREDRLESPTPSFHSNGRFGSLLNARMLAFVPLRPGTTRVSSAVLLSVNEKATTHNGNNLDLSQVDYRRSHLGQLQDKGCTSLSLRIGTLAR